MVLESGTLDHGRMVLESGTLDHGRMGESATEQPWTHG